MATFKATRVGSPDLKPGPGDAQSLKCAVSQYSLAAALALSDVIEGPLIPKGATIVDVMVTATDLDTGGSPSITLDVGYGVDPDYFVAASTTGQAGGVIRAAAATAKPLVLDADDTIDVLVKAAPATGATSGTVSIAVFFLPANG